MTFQEIKKNKAIKDYITAADASLSALGYTEHSFAHVTAVAEKAGYILQTLGYDDRTVELVKIAGYLHDIGNLVNRVDHSQSGRIIDGGYIGNIFQLRIVHKSQTHQRNCGDDGADGDEGGTLAVLIAQAFIGQRAEQG